MSVGPDPITFMDAAVKGRRKGPNLGCDGGSARALDILAHVRAHLVGGAASTFDHLAIQR